MKFTATVIDPYTNSTTANMLFADPETNPDEPSVLSFSRAIEFKDSAYYFEINDQSNSSYGGLEFVRLSRNKLEVKLQQATVEKFGNENFTNIEVLFDIDDEMYKTLLETLQNIFDGHAVLEII